MPSPPAGQPVPPGRARRWPARLIPIALVLAVAILVAVVAMMPKDVAQNPPQEIPPVNVEVLRIRAIPELADTFTLTAVVEPLTVVRVAAEVAGRIERLGERQQPADWLGGVLAAGTVVAEGEPVCAGDHLLHLNSDLLEAQHARAAAQFEYDQREYRRILDLFEQGATSQTELEDAGTRRDISAASLAEVERQLERTTIVAPIGGILNRLLMEVGEYPVPGDPVAEIVYVDRVLVVVDIPERDVHYLEVGQTTEVLPAVPAGACFTGDVTYIGELADEGTRTTRLEITVDNHDQRLRSGQIVRARLTRRVLENIIMIPLGAVIPLENGKAVYVVVKDHAERRDVELGFIKGRTVQVLRGLQADDRLIVAGHRYVGPGQSVKVVQEQ